MKDHNPHLAPGAFPGDKGSAAAIEQPDAVENIPWQTRGAPPTQQENALADALQAIFADEVYELPRVIERLDRLGVKPPEGAARWTEEVFRAALRRLGS